MLLIWLFIIVDRITVPDKERILWGLAYPQAPGFSESAATVYVWDLIKTRMHEAIVRHRQYVLTMLHIADG